MGYQKRVPLLMLLDSLIVMFAIYVGYFILYPNAGFTLPMLLVSSITLVLCHHFFAFRYRLYHKVWEYASVGEVVAIVKAVTFSIIVTGLIQLIVFQYIYLRVLGITWMLHVILIGGSRFSWRLFRDHYIKPNAKKKRTLIIGAGSAGTMVARQLLQNNDADLKPVAFVDDDDRKYMFQIYGLTVAGKIADIPVLVEKLQIENIIIAIPSLSKEAINEIYKQCAKTTAKTQIMPMLEDLMTGKISINEIRDVEVEDLLGREPVELDTSRISKKLKGKTVLVTGAGGSIGSEICRQVCTFQPKRMLLLGHGEYSIYNIEMELRNKYAGEIELIPIIADIQDRNRIFEVMEEHRPHVVYHAAAHKHVPLMEANPRAAVNNNIFGTKNVAEASETFGVKSFVLVSTDKAVNPPNVMGATKRIAEMIIQNMAKKSNTKFVAVRFGNVLGSRGSVIPLFKKQIKNGGPVTVTHPDMTRYFMTIPEASRLVIQAGTLAKGGEIFVLDMGEPVKIVDLAKNLIKLSGYSEEDISIEFTGIRPGEKMYEELLGEDEVHPGEVYKKIYVGRTREVDGEKVELLLGEFERIPKEHLKDWLMRIVYGEEKMLTKV